MGQYDGTIETNTITYGPGPVANSSAFDNAWVIVPAAVMAPPCTLAYWVKLWSTVPANPSVAYVAFGGTSAGNEAHWMGIDSGGRFVSNANNAVTPLANYPADNGWHHIALTRDGAGNAKAYFDGVGTTVVDPGYEQMDRLDFRRLGILGDYDWMGPIGPAVVYDHVAYSGNFTPPTSAPAAGSGVRALWLWQGDATDSAMAGGGSGGGGGTLPVPGLARMLTRFGFSRSVR